MLLILSFSYKCCLLRIHFQWKIWCSPGSVLGPLFFILFNDIHLSLNNAIIKSFADEANFFIAGNNFDLLRVTVTSELNLFKNGYMLINLQLTVILKNQAIMYLSLETNSSPIQSKTVYVLGDRKQNTRKTQNTLE